MEIKGSNKYVTLYISSKFYSLDKMKITSSESKGKLEKPGKVLVTSLGFKTKIRLQKYKKARYAIRNVSEKELLKNIKEFEKIDKLPYTKKRPKHEPADRYFHLARHLEKCMMRSDNLNWYDHCSYTEMTDPSSNINVMNEDELKCSIVNKKLSENSSTNANESKRIIVHKNLSQNFSANKDE